MRPNQVARSAIGDAQLPCRRRQGNTEIQKELSQPLNSVCAADSLAAPAQAAVSALALPDLQSLGGGRSCTSLAPRALVFLLLREGRGRDIAVIIRPSIGKEWQVHPAHLSSFYAAQSL